MAIARARLAALKRAGATSPAMLDVTGHAGLDLLATAVLMLHADRHVVYANPAAENLLETSRRRLVGSTPGGLFVDADPLEHAIARAALSGASYAVQEIVLDVIGKSRLHVACTVSPIVHGDAAFLVEFRQIEQQLKIAREERLLEQQHANRELVRNLAHEIKNPLGGIRGAAQLLEREVPQPHLAEYTHVIIGEADRLQTLVSRLLTPSRLPTYRRTNIHEILVRVRSVVQAEFPGVHFILDFDASIPEFDADSDQLAQAVLNIVKNAAQALAAGTALPQIALATRVAHGVTVARRRHRLGLVLTVRDNGPGIPEAIRNRIFYPLVSGRDGGTGLGLTIAQTYVAQHEGTIEWTSEPGRTAFSIILPLDRVRTPD